MAAGIVRSGRHAMMQPECTPMYPNVSWSTMTSETEDEDEEMETGSSDGMGAAR